jgi:hypothetical protein
VKRGQKRGSRRPCPRGLGQRARFASLSHVFAYCSSLDSTMRKSNGAARLGRLTRTRNAAMTSPLHVAAHCAIRKRILKGKKQDPVKLKRGAARRKQKARRQQFRQLAELQNTMKREETKQRRQSQVTGSSTPNKATPKDTTYETKAACKLRLLLEKLKQKSYKGLSDKELRKL